MGNTVLNLPAVYIPRVRSGKDCGIFIDHHRQEGDGRTDSGGYYGRRIGDVSERESDALLAAHPVLENGFGIVGVVLVVLDRSKRSPRVESETPAYRTAGARRCTGRCGQRGLC